ncbi:hypothetical protein ACFVSX_26310 [Streptomyces rubiginosohelvolus]|uniref:hypothetical protein n=1 Tax=Streptomyces rubiginosohelvolus TaxID=67362 RepID=UPI0036D7B5E3
MIIWLNGTFRRGEDHHREGGDLAPPGLPALVERIETDTKPESADAKQWRLDHLTDYERALPWLRREAQVVDTTGVLPAEVAETVLRGVRTG